MNHMTTTSIQNIHDLIIKTNEFETKDFSDLIETYMGAYQAHKKVFGSFKHLTSDAYNAAMKQRYDYQLQKVYEKFPMLKE